MMLFIAVFLGDQETLDKLVVFPPLGPGKTPLQQVVLSEGSETLEVQLEALTRSVSVTSGSIFTVTGKIRGSAFQSVKHTHAAFQCWKMIRTFMFGNKS